MFHCGSHRFDLSRPLVMGIVNVTPDSFSDGGRGRPDSIAHAMKLLEEGADILDIGGESTRPGAEPVGVQEELDRVMPILEVVCGAGVPVSIDTYKPEVMEAALKAGASLVNDVNALQTPGALEVVVASDAAVCLMHKQGTFLSMQSQPSYVDVVAEVMAFLAGRLQVVLQAGVDSSRVLIDPGFGFGKTLAHNVALLRELHRFNELAVPVVAGISRKSMIGALTGRDTGQRVFGSIAAALLAVDQGARIVRVHDVAATVDALRIWQAVRNSS